MTDLKKLLDGIIYVLEYLFGKDIPPLILQVVSACLLIGIILAAIFGFLTLISKIRDLWVEKFWPLFHNAGQRRRSLRRQRFAQHLASELQQLDNLEEWKDYRFAELEAEVEAEGRRRARSIIPFWRRTRTGLRREASLTEAIEASREPLILVEGEPGSGKSVALRHVAQNMAARAIKARRTDSILPVYVNLKGLDRPSGAAIDRELIASFVRTSLNRPNNRDIEEFLDEELKQGLEDGTWFFLFDSFDELPDVLSSTEADALITSYAQAIADFLGGLNQCRGVIASRQFRGPGRPDWPRFTVLALSEQRRSELIRKADLHPEDERRLIGQLANADAEIRNSAGNPMFLALLCEYMKDHSDFPSNAHVVFEAYVTSRLTRDAERLQRRFGLTAGCVRVDHSVKLPA